MIDKFASASMHLESAPPNQTPDFMRALVRKFLADLSALLSSHVDLIGGPHRSIHSCEILWCCLRRGRVSGINEAIVEFDPDHRGHLIGSMRRAV
jgi:hypothetical protein